MRILAFISYTVLILSPSLGRAEDLLAIYQLAQVNDPSIQAAKEAQLAAKEAFPQARALFLPVVSAAANKTTYSKKYKANNISFSNLSIPLANPKFHYDQSVYGLTLFQPVFYYQQWVQLAKASIAVKQANAIYAAAEQDLVVRTVQRYFEVLRAIDTLKFVKSQREAFSKLLEQTKGRFEAGVLNTITDVQIAKARYDNSYAQALAAENNITVQKRKLQEITGKKIENFFPLRHNLNFKSPDPENIERWINNALEQNLDLQAARYQVEALREDIKLNRANHLPTLNIDGAISRSGSTKDIFPIPKSTSSYIGLQVAIPLFNGGMVVSQIKQARHIYEQTYQQMEVLYRQVESNTSEAYLNILTQIGQMQALKQALASNQTALEGTNAAFKAGTRTIVDVLNAQSDYIKAQQDYANARYNYILQSVQLKKAAGILCPEDVQNINLWLQF